MTQKTIDVLISKMNEGKVFGIFHNDLDGYGCGKVVSTYFDMQDALYLPYNRVNKEIDNFCKEGFKNYNGLVVADLSLDKDNLEKVAKLAKTGYPVMYFDHHFKTNEQIEILKKSRIFNILNNEICATKILFNYLTEKEFLPRVENVDNGRFATIVDLIDAWDTYKFQDPETYEVINDDARDFQLYFKEFGAIKIFEKIDNYITCKFENIYSNMEIANIRLLKRDIRKAVNDRNKNLDVIQFPFEGEIMNIGITYAEKDFSEIGNRLNILNKNLSFIVVIDMVHKSVNFRTIFDKPNLAKVAAMYGGGGHPKAAGCELNEAAFNAFINKNLSREQVDALLNFNIQKNEEVATDEVVEG